MAANRIAVISAVLDFIFGKIWAPPMEAVGPVLCGYIEQLYILCTIPPLQACYVWIYNTSYIMLNGSKEFKSA